MKLFVFIAAVAVVANAATVKDPSSCVDPSSSNRCLIFEDNFDFLDTNVWEHEITMGGGGNWEFQVYDNNRSISFCRDGYLHIKPQLLLDRAPDFDLSANTLELWGSNGKGDVCTGNGFYGCSRTGSATNYVNPIVSARLRSLGGFSFKYGYVEVRAKMPKGDWLWPAIWLLPQSWPYGLWPASGEIDIVEAIGNVNGTGVKNTKYAGTTLHWGPYYPQNRYDLTHDDYSVTGVDESKTFTEEFNTWGFEWLNDSMTFYLNNRTVLVIDPASQNKTGFWDWGDFDSLGVIDNIWSDGNIMTPFDQKFYFILNVAVGGTNGFFPDSDFTNKPWANSDSDSFKNFWDAKDEWLPTWDQDPVSGRPRAEMLIDYIRVYKITDY